MSFDTMVLFGDHAADPHGEPGDRTLKENEWVLFDLGTMVDGYQVTLHVPVFFGSESAKDPRHQEIYDIVQKAHDTAIQAVKPGMKASEIDKIARDIIAEAGYGEYFIHRLGHGIGQSVHEFLRLWKETIWNSLKECASLLNLVCIFQVTTVFVSKTA